jgi:two-component system OmpR family sensor kinase
MMGPMTTDATSGSAASARSAGFTVRTRITVAVAVLTGLALAGAGLVVYVLESARIDRDVSDQVEQELGEFAALRTGDDPRTGRRFVDVTRLIRLYLQRNVPYHDELFLGYWDGGPRVGSTARSVKGFVTYGPFVDLVERRLESGGSERLRTARWGEVVVTVQPASDSNTKAAFVIVSFLADEYVELDRVMRTYAMVSLLSLGLITAAAAWQSGRLLGPLRALRATAHDITETDLSRRIPESGHDDITALTRTFNEMLERLDRAFSDQRRFLDDAGHELKTPLTVIRGHMELLDGDDAAEVEATRLLLLDETDRMARLVNDLIVLAKADRPDFVSPGPADVGPFTRTVLDKCRALGERRWVLDEAADLLAVLDEQRVTQAMLQLAQNAVKHTHVGGEVGVGSRVEPGRGLRLWVRDDGPGVPHADKERVFDRFTRSAVPEEDEGFGLGLSIVRAIAVAHGGTVHVEDAEPRGARFVLTLPRRRKDDLWHGS